MASWISRMFGKSRANTATSKPDVAAAHQALVEGAALQNGEAPEPTPKGWRPESRYLEARRGDLR